MSPSRGGSVTEPKRWTVALTPSRSTPSETARAGRGLPRQLARRAKTSGVDRELGGRGAEALHQRRLLGAERGRDRDGAAPLGVAAVAGVDAAPEERGRLGLPLGGVGAGGLGLGGVRGDQAAELDRGSGIDAVRDARLAVGVAGDGEEARRAGLRDGREQHVEPALAHGDGDVEVVADGGAHGAGRVEDVGGHAAVEAGLVQGAQIDRDQAAEAPPVGGAVAARRQVDRLHEVGVDHGAEPAVVVEAGDAHAVDVDARVLGGRPPHHERPRARGGPRHAGEVLHDLQHVARGAGHLPRLIGLHLGGDDLLAERGRGDDDLLLVGVRRGGACLGLLDLVGRLDALARLEDLLGAHAGHALSREIDGPLARGHALDREAPGLVGDGARTALDLQGGARDRLPAPAEAHHARERRRGGRLDLEGEGVPVEDLHRRRHAVERRRLEHEAPRGRERRGVEGGAAALRHLDRVDGAGRGDGDLEHHGHRPPRRALRLGVGGLDEVEDLRRRDLARSSLAGAGLRERRGGGREAYRDRQREEEASRADHWPRLKRNGSTAVPATGLPQWLAGSKLARRAASSAASSRP